MVSNRLRELRKEHGMSISELARRAGVSRMAISNIELEGRCPNGSSMLAISTVLKLDPREIFFLKNAIQE